MNRIAIKISSDLIELIKNFTGAEESPFGENTYAMVEFPAPNEINLKLMDEDEMFEIVKHDNEVPIVSM